MSESLRESFVTVSKNTIHFLSKSLENIRESNTLTSSQKDFLSHLLLQFERDGNESSFTITEIYSYRKSIGKSISKYRIREILNKFSKQGVLIKEERKTGRSGKAISRYTVSYIYKDFYPAPSKSVPMQRFGKVNRGNNQLILQRIRSENLQILTDYDDSKLVTEALFTGLFDRVMRLSKHESPSENRIVTAIRIKGVTIRLQASSPQSGKHELATLEDQRVIRIIVNKVLAAIEHWTPPMTWTGACSRELEDRRKELNERIRKLEFKESVSNGYQWKAELSAEERSLWLNSRFQTAENKFFLDAVDLAIWLGYKNPSSSSVREVVNKALWRLHKTEFTIDIGGDRDKELFEDAVRVKELLGLDGLHCRFQFFPELCSQYSEKFEFSADQSGLTIDCSDTNSFINDLLRQTRIWQFSLSEDLFDRLKDPSFRNIFSVNEEIFYETSGIGQSLYNFFSSILSAGSNNNAGYNQSLSVLKRTIWPSRTFVDFDNEIVKWVRKLMDEKLPGEFDESLGSNCVSAYGFTFTLYRGERDALWLNVF